MMDQSVVATFMARFARLSASNRNSSEGRRTALLDNLRGRAAKAGLCAGLAAAALLTGAVQASAQNPTPAPTWNQQSPASSPSERIIDSMAYDAAHSQMVMFGGIGASGYLTDTWLWNGATWTQSATTTFPSARGGSFMAYNAAAGNVVLFGGLTNSSVRDGDTWIWNGTTWTQVTPALSPSARASGSMVYDAALGKVVLFGGVDGSGSLDGDTWVWDGTTWTQIFPAHSPSARSSYGMSYDAINEQVVLFGGSGNSGYLNDTWVYNGVDWTQVSPATQPTARYIPGMSYNTALGETVLFGGYDGTNYLNDTWTWNGTNWTQTAPLTQPSVRGAANEMVYDAAVGQVVLLGGYNGSTGLTDTWAWGVQQNFGSVNVCPSGQSTPAPCSNTISLAYSFPGNVTLGTPQVVTQGTAGLDFAQANGGNCSGTIQGGSSCTLNVTFKPQFAGLRTGAVNIVDNGGNLLTSTLIYGTGQGPQIVYGPAFSGTSVLGGPALEAVIGTSPFTLTPKGMATDAAGDLFVANPSTGQLVKRAANGTTTNVGTLSAPQGVAVDGAGDLFVADTGLREIVEIPAGCVTAACETSVYNPVSADPVAVAVDGMGDLFIADASQGGVVEVPAGCLISSCWIPIGSNWHSVANLALDAAGDLFVSDSSAGFVAKFPAGCTTNSCRTTIGSFIVPQGLAADAAGDVIVSDIAAAGGMGDVVELPAGCTSSSCQIILSYLTAAFDVTVDQLGQVYIGDVNNHQVLRINTSVAPTEGFADTSVGATSTDSPQSFTLLNVGNQTLSSVLPGFAATGPNFYQVSGTGTPADCSANFSLAPGAGCNASISFMPQQTGLLAGSATATDNNLNAASSTQLFSLSGNGLGTGVPLTLSGLGNGSVISIPPGINCSIVAGIGSGTCTANFPANSLVTLQASPGSGFAFQAWGAGCTGSLQSLSCSFTITGGTAETASFVAGFPVTVTEVGTGTGTVSSSTAAIACALSGGVDSGTCSGNVPAGTQVALTAIPSGNSIFAGWGGDCASSGASLSCLVTANSALNVIATYAAPGAAQPGNLKPITAGVVYGQGGSFSTNNTGVGAGGLNNPVAVATDPLGNLYVADRSNNRVLYYPAGSTTATRVYGQNGSFTTNGENTNGLSATSMNQPWAVAVDAGGNLYVADQFNYRVLYFPFDSSSGAAQATPTRVYGQNGLYTTANPGLSSTGLSGPQGLALDGTGNLYVADGARVLFFPAGTTTATRVYGQGGSFTTNTANNGGITANSLNNAQGLVVDSSGGLYVAEIYNNRVLYFPPGSTTATRVYGQGGSFTSNTSNNGGISANSMFQPQGLALDSGGNLYVTEYSNNRVLYFPFGSTTATRVYGQGGGFTTNTVNYPSGAISANSLRQPTGVALDASGNVYVGDIFNNRVVEYGPSGYVNVCPSGQTTPAPCSSTMTLSYYAPSTATVGSVSVVTQGTAGLDFAQANGGNCSGTVSAGNTCTLNVSFTPLNLGTRMGAVQLLDNSGDVLASQPVYGVGQGPAIAISPGTQTVLPITGLNRPNKLSLDAAGDLFITDYANNQIVEYTAGGVQTTVPTSGLNNPSGVAVDGTGNLFIGDNGNHRVVEIPAGCTTAACQVTLPITGLQSPSSVVVDGAGDLFIADFGIGGVVKFTPGGVQSMVPATGLSGPFGAAVDAAGDVFIADTYGNQVVEVTAGGIQTTVPTPGVTSPENVWVDAAGDVFVVDWIGTGRIYEIAAGSEAETLVYTGDATEGVVTDGAGDLFIANTFAGQIVEISDSFLTLNLGVVSEDFQSVDTPVTFQNVGNQTLTGSMGAVLGPNFFKDQINSTCGNFSLAPGATCVQSFYATAQTVGSISANAIVNDNSLNNPAGNQTITLTALSTGPAVTLTATGAGTGSGLVVQDPTGINCGFVAGSSVSGPCTSSFSTGLTVSFEEIPTGGSTFAGWGGACGSFGTNQICTVFVTSPITVTANFASSVTLVTVPNVVALLQSDATTSITGASLTLGTVTTAFSSSVPAGSVASQNPAAGAQANPGDTVDIVISEGQPPAADQLSLDNNYFVTGDYVSAGVTLRGTGGPNGLATGTITVASSPAGNNQGVPDGADVLAAYLYWESVENTPSPSAANGTFNGYAISGQQIGTDQPYTDGALSGTLRVYRASVNTYIPVGANGLRFASGTYTVSLPDGGGAALPLTEGASLVVIYRVLAPNFPLKSIVIYDGSAIPTATTGALSQTVQGFYDAVGGANGTGELTNLYGGGGSWNGSSSSVTLGHPDQYSETLSPGNAYAAVILSTPVNNSDKDGILDAWKAGPGGGDVHAGQPGYYDVKTQAWVALPGALHGEQDLFVQLDYMCSAFLADGVTCDFTQENLYPSPDASGNDPLAMVQQAFAADGVALHLNIGNAVPEDTCTDSPGQLCEFPNQPGVVSWDNSVQISKVWPRNFTSCASGGDCTPRFQYGQKDSYHYVLFGFSLAIPAWNTRYGTLTSIQVANNVATITTADRGTGLYACPSRVTISGVLGSPNLNGVYNTTSCASSTSITLATSNVPDWSYPNSTLPEPVIGLTPGLVSSISGYSDLGGSDSAVTLGLWETAPNQDMSKAANVIAGTLFHEIGHTLGLTHGGLYYDTPNSYIPTFEANCKPNLQSSMNYLFQLDGVGPNLAVAYSNQTMNTVTRASAGSIAQLTDSFGGIATFPTSSWYTPTAPTTGTSAATMHCDGTPIGNDTPAYRINGPIAPITPAWMNQQNITYDGQAYTSLRGYNEVANMDLRQVAATGGEFADLASVLNFGASASPLDIAAGGSATLGSGGRVTLGSGGIVTLGSGGNVTLGSGGTITLGSGGRVTLGSGGNVTLGSGGVVTPGSDGRVTLGSGGSVSLSSGGDTISFSSGGTVTLGSGGIVTLGSGGGTINGVPEPAGPFTVNSGGIIALGSGGVVTLGSGGIVALGSGGIIALGSGGTVALGSGGRVTLGSGGIVALGSGGNVTLGSGGNVTLDSGGIVALGSGGTITLGSGGIVTLGSGGSVTLGGDLSAGSGGNVTLGAGGVVTLGSGGTVTLGSGGRVVLGSGGRVTLGSGGIIALGSGGTVTLGSGGIVTLGSGGAIVNGVPEPAGQITVSSGGIIALGSGGTVALGSGGDATLSSGGTITLGSGGIVTLGSGGRVTLGSGGVVTLGSGGTIALGSGGNVALGSGGRVTLGSGGASTSELTYETANSVVRPPSAPTETPMTTGGSTSVRVDWTAPVFGVVQTYAIYRSSNGATPILIGSVSGVNGFAPATTFTDTNPDLTSSTVVYTISTVLAPVAIDPTSRQSVSVPAVLTNDQTIVLGSLPSSVTISSSTLTVTATAMSAGVPSGLQVNFSASPAATCSISNQSMSGGVSTATVALNSAGSCAVTASQPGSSATQLQTGVQPLYNAASSVSGTFMILPQGSSTQSQMIIFPTLPNMQYGNKFSLGGISASSGLPIVVSASGPCTTSGGISGVGLCTITATQAGNSTYSAASESQSFTIFPAVLQVTAAPVSVVYGQAIPPLTNFAYSGFVNGDTSAVISGTPALSTTASSTSNAGSYPITVSTGTLATANYSFLYVSGTLTITQASQAITFSTPPPASAAFNSSFTVAATGGASGNAVAFTSAGACSITGTGAGSATYTMNNSTGTCSVIANQAGNTNYSNALMVTKSVNASGPLASVSPSTINFGSVNLGSITTQNITVTNVGTAPLTVNQPILSIVKGGNSNEFVAVNLCLIPLPAGKSCTITIAFVAGPFYTPQTATLNIMDNAPGGPQPVTLSALVLMPQTISFTTSPPATAVYNSSFTVAATGGASGNPVTFTSGGACSNSGARYTMTSGTGSCSVIANQAGNATYAAAGQVTKTVAATPLAQTITFTTNPPATAAYNSSFTVAATGGASGNAVTFTSAGACNNSGAKYTMTSGTGSCSVIANQAGNSIYGAATQVTKSVSATQVAQTITFTTTPPASAAYKSTFTVAATASSGLGVTFTSSGACSNSGATYTMTSGAGTCSVIASQAGNSNYSAATAVTKTAVATLAAQTITFTTNPPASAAYKTTFTVAATGGASGNAVTFTSSGACSNSGATYTMTSGTGTCSVIANQAGTTNNYSAATAVTKTVAAAYSTASLSPTSLSFGTVTSGKSSSAQTATLTNTGTTPLIISSIGFTGTNPTNFTQTNTCPSSSSSLAAGKSCTISVVFNSGGKAVTANLTVTDNIQAGTQSVAVSGN